MTDIGLRRVQTFHAALGFIVIPFYINQNMRRSAIFGQLHSGHADQTDARIAQLTFHERLNFLAQGFAQTSAMIFDCALLHVRHSR